MRDQTSNTSYAARAGDFTLDSNDNLFNQNDLHLQGLTGGGISFSAADVNGQLVYMPTTTAPSTTGDLNINYSSSVGSGITNDTGGAFTDAQVNAGAPTVSSYAIGTDGTLNLNLSNGDSFAAGQVMLQNFQDPNALVRTGNNLYTTKKRPAPKAAPPSPPPTTAWAPTPGQHPGRFAGRRA